MSRRHLRIMVAEAERVGFEIEHGKTVGGNVFVSLGLRQNRSTDSIDCPTSKRATMLRDLKDMGDGAQRGDGVHRKPLMRTVGRLLNLTQVMPELKPYMRGGFGLIKVLERQGRRRGYAVSKVPLSPGSDRGREFLGMIDVASQLLRENNGVAMAPAPRFDKVGSPGVLTLTSDASGAESDGGGGAYMFSPAHPGTVFFAHSAWPTQLEAALAEGAKRRRDRSPGAHMLSMPAAELLWQWIGAETARKAGIPFEAVVAIGDCRPAAGAITVFASPVRQLSFLLQRMHETAKRWLGVAVPRELNVDADRLSHPSMAPAVVADAAAAGLRTVVLAGSCDQVDPAIWQAALEMATLAPWEPDPDDARPWRERN